MGADWVGGVVNVSGSRSPYMRYADKSGFGKNPNPPNGARTARSATTISGANGPACKIVAKICYPNSPEASKVLRNVKRVQGPYSFELARSAAGNNVAGV
jgi:hypothetical protein